MKKHPFANRVSYSGNRNDLAKFAELLIASGYTIDQDELYSSWQPGKISILTCPDGTFGYFNHKGAMPDFWFKASQLKQALIAATIPAL